MTNPLSNRVIKMFDEEYKTVQEIALELDISPEKVDSILDKADGYEVPKRRDPTPYKSNEGPKKPAVSGGIGYQRRHGAAFGEIVVLPRVPKSGEGRTKQPKGHGYKPTGRPNGLRKDLKPAECGTPSGYSKHLRNNEEPCRPCKDSKNEAKRISYANIKARKEEEAAAMTDRQEPQSESVDVAAVGQAMNEMAHAPDMTVEDAKDRYEEIVKESLEVVEAVPSHTTYPFNPDYSTESLAVEYAQYIGFVKTEIEKIHYPSNSSPTGTFHKKCVAEWEAWPCKTIRVIREAEAKFSGNTDVQD